MTARVANLLEVFGFLSMIVVAVGFLGKWHFLPDLCSHFRVQATGTLILCSVPLYLLRRRKWAYASFVIGLGLSSIFVAIPQATLSFCNDRLQTVIH